VITVSTRGTPPLPNSEDYRPLANLRYDVDFYQEEGIPGNFTINLPADEEMDIDAEEDEAVGMEEDTPQDEVEVVENQQDLTLLSGFSKALTSIHHHLLQIMCLIIGGPILIVMMKHWVQEWVLMILKWVSKICRNFT
jgi:hypothetical protein